MNFSGFIASRLLKGKISDKLVSRPIVRIATVGIALGMAVMILSIGVVTGFQKKIRDKVIGFGSHIQITNFGTANRFESPKLKIDQDFYPSLNQEKGVKHIQPYALKQGIIETSQNIQGVLVKGVGPDYDWDFMRQNLLSGNVLSPSDSANRQVLISEFLANRLNLKLGDNITVYFTNNDGDMTYRRFAVHGIYNTGLQELDQQFIFISLSQIQKINSWGLEAQMIVEDCTDGRVKLRAMAFGGDGEQRLHWSDGKLAGGGPYSFCIDKDTTIFVVAKDRSETIPDTAFFKVRFDNPPTGCTCPDTSEYAITTTGGSYRYYAGGFEVLLDDYEHIMEMDQAIYERIGFDLKTTTILQRSPEIFNWLEMLDINTQVLIILMILVSIINMSSALLILILERTNMIGILKALGAKNGQVRQIFLRQAGYLILIGMLAGNVLGISLGFLQQHFGIIKLDPSLYYVSQVPVLLEPVSIIFLNILTLIVCMVVLFLPSLIINNKSPVKAIRFD